MRWFRHLCQHDLNLKWCLMYLLKFNGLLYPPFVRILMVKRWAREDRTTFLLKGDNCNSWIFYKISHFQSERLMHFRWFFLSGTANYEYFITWYSNNPVALLRSLKVFRCFWIECDWWIRKVWTSDLRFILFSFFLAFLRQEIMNPMRSRNSNSCRTTQFMLRKRL